MLEFHDIPANRYHSPVPCRRRATCALEFQADIFGLFRTDTNYWTCSSMLWLWLLNSGAYMHWISAMPVWYWPRCTTRVEYSNT